MDREGERSGDAVWETDEYCSAGSVLDGGWWVCKRDGRNLQGLFWFFLFVGLFLHFSSFCSFTQHAHQFLQCHVGGWAKDRQLKEIGRLGKVLVLKVVEPYSLALFTRVLGFTYQEAQSYLERVRAEMMNSKCHLYFFFHFVYGQRPMETNETPI